MSYTDENMRAFSQIAYADFTKAYEYLQATEGGTSFSINDLMIAAKAIDPKVNLDMLYCLTDEQKTNWRIGAVHDTNSKNGFYGCIIETGDGNAALAFRGSESKDNPDNIVHDWMSSDAGLLGSPQTRQHMEVDRFLNKYKDQINGYDNISLTGHSLGGNLSDYATLVSHRYGFDGKIDRSVNLDGPGFSDEFIKLHLTDILRMNGKMEHVKWSWCGGLLLDLPGVKSREVKVSDDANRKDDVNHDYLTRHDTKYLVFDENGNLVEGKREFGDYFLDAFSDLIEYSPNVGIVSAFLTAFSWLYGEWDEIEKFFGDLAKDFKTTYKNIVKGFKKLFHLDLDYFKVDTNRLSEDTDEIRAQINRVKNYVDDMFLSVQKLGAMWTGPANKAFTGKFIKDKQDIAEYLEQIDAYVLRLESDSKNYSSTENRAVAMIGSVKI